MEDNMVWRGAIRQGGRQDLIFQKKIVPPAIGTRYACRVDAEAMAQEGGLAVGKTGNDPALAIFRWHGLAPSLYGDGAKIRFSSTKFASFGPGSKWDRLVGLRV
jgi:hypothetical protein